MEIKKLKIHKKAVGGSVIVGVVATFIIILAIILFLVLAMFLAEKKSFLGKSKILIKKNEIDFSLSNKLFIFLNSPVKININGINTMKDLILYSIEPYNNNKIIKRLKGGDINNLYLSPSSITLEGKKRAYLMDIEARKILREFCENYILKVPQGYILSKKDVNYLYEWGEEAEIKIPYNGKTIKIKYKQAKKC